MAKCECCGEREANRFFSGDADYTDGLAGAGYSFICRDQSGGLLDIAQRIRARRAQQIKARGEEVRVVTQYIKMTIGFTAPTINCLRCSSPATRDVYCVYCLQSSGYAGPAERDAVIAKCTVTDAERNGAARARNEAALAAEKPRATKQSKELAKPHPWECDE